MEGRLKAVEKAVRDAEELCPACGGRHVDAWLPLALCGEEPAEGERLCACGCCADAIAALVGVGC